MRLWNATNAAFTFPKGAQFVRVWAGALLFWTLIGHAAPHGKTCELEVVEKVSLTAIGQTVSNNGVPVSAKKIESRETKDVILNAYLEKWRHTEREPFDAKVVDGRRWLIASKAIGNCFHTLQLDKKAFQASGYISTLSIETERKNSQKHSGKEVPQLYGSSVLSDVSHEDPGKKARTLVIANKFSPDANAEFYLRTIGEDGWKIMSDHTIPMKGSSRSSRALTFAKGLETQIIVINVGPTGSHVVVQWMEKP